MFICPTCGKYFDLEDILVKHYMKCWKEKNLNHKSKPAPRSEDINTREINDEVLNFFNAFK